MLSPYWFQTLTSLAFFRPSFSPRLVVVKECDSDAYDYINQNLVHIFLPSFPESQSDGNHKKASNLDFNETIKLMRERNEEVYHLAFGQSPFPVPDCFVQALRDNAGANEYLPVAGLGDLRKAVAAFHFQHDGLSYDQDSVVIGPGSKEMIYLAIKLFDGDILLPSPSWTTYLPQVRLAGKKDPIFVDCNFDGSWKVTKSALMTAVKKSSTPARLLIFNNPNNPAGTAYTLDELKDIGQLCRDQNVTVLSDEIYARLNYDSKHVSMASIIPERTILTSGFSKWASAGGWRVGYAIFPKTMDDLKIATISAASHTYSCAAAPIQKALAKGLRDHENELDDYMSATKKVLKLVSEFVARELQSVGVKVVDGQGGYYVLPDFEICRTALAQRGIQTGAEMCQAILKEAKVALMDGAPFLRPSKELTTRLCFVDFDGLPCLTDIPSHHLTPEERSLYVLKYAPNVAKAIANLKDFVVKHS